MYSVIRRRVFKRVFGALAKFHTAVVDVPALEVLLEILCSFRAGGDDGGLPWAPIRSIIIPCHRVVTAMVPLLGHAYEKRGCTT